MSGEPPKKKRIRLSADYGCHPLWWDGGDEVGDIDPRSLPLTSETIAALDAWAATFDAWMDPADPTAPGPDEATVERFDADGRALWRRVREELGPGWVVRYRTAKGGALLEPDD